MLINLRTYKEIHMDERVVIARAHRGEPLRRIVIKVAHGRIYLANPASLEAIKAGESAPIGFPESDVFLFDSEAYMKLRAQWENGQRTDPLSWQNLSSYRP
jgi:hypothetical protein